MKSIDIQGLLILGAIIVVAGILLIASQQFSNITSGASADVLNYDELPETLQVDKEEYRQVQDLVSYYKSVDDLATKNSIVQEIEARLLNWAK